MKLRYTTLSLACVTTIVCGGSAFAQVLTSGNLVVERFGTGAAALSSASTAVFLDQYSTTGTLGTGIVMPTTGATQLTNSGTATSEGLITVSPNGLFLNSAGYNTTTGTAAVNGTTSAVNNRVVNLIGADGTITRGGTTSTAFSGGNIRSAISNGADVWATGSTTGTVYLGSGTAAEERI